MDCQRVAHGVAGAPNESRLLELMERTGYPMIQENGQRKFGGPPPGWQGITPSKGCEVFVGKIPRDLYEDELVPVFEKIGKIYELRLMMDFSGSNRGYAFVMYTSSADARRAVKELNNFEIRKGRLIGVCHSVDNCRLFVGGIPKNKYKTEIMEEMRKVTDGVVDVIVYPSATDKTKNRGFAFVEYENHRAAAMARRKLNLGRIQLWGHQIAVDWAEPEQDVDEEIMVTVKVLYVRNLMLSTSEEAIEKYFNDLISNSVERVKKIRDYAFVHFNNRENAVHAMGLSNGQMLDGSHIEVVFAKPPDKVTRQQSKSMSTLLSTDALTSAYLPFHYDLASAFAGVPLAPGLANSAGSIYTNQNAAAAMSAMQISSSAAAAAAGAPAVMAPGISSLGALSSADFLNRSLGLRSQVGAIRGRGRGAAGMRGAGATRAAYMQQPLMQARRRTPSEVSIPALTGHYPQPFSPDNLLPTPDEAKQYAAEYVLGKLQFPVQNNDGAGGDTFSVSSMPQHFGMQSAQEPRSQYVPRSASLQPIGSGASRNVMSNSFPMPTRGAGPSAMGDNASMFSHNGSTPNYVFSQPQGADMMPKLQPSKAFTYPIGNLGI